MSMVNVALLVVAVIALVYIVWYVFQMRAIWRDESISNQSMSSVCPGGPVEPERSTRNRSHL